MDAGFFLAFPLHHGDLELDSVGIFRRKIMLLFLVAWPYMVGGPMREMKIPMQEVWLKMLGGLMH